MLTLKGIAVDVFGLPENQENLEFINFFFDEIIGDIPCSIKTRSKVYYSYCTLSTTMRVNFYHSDLDNDPFFKKTNQINSRALFDEDMDKYISRIYRGWVSYVRECGIDYLELDDRLNSLALLESRKVFYKKLLDRLESIESAWINTVEIKLTLFTLIALFKTVFWGGTYQNKAKKIGIMEFQIIDWGSIVLLAHHDLSLDDLHEIDDKDFKREDVLIRITDTMKDSDNRIVLRGDMSVGVDAFANKIFSREHTRYDLVFRIKQTAGCTLREMVDDVFSEYIKDELIHECSNDVLMNDSISKLVVIEDFNTYKNSDIAYIDSWKNCALVITTTNNKLWPYPVIDIPRLDADDLRDIFWNNYDGHRIEEETITGYIDDMIAKVDYNTHVIKKIAVSCSKSSSIESYYNKFFKNKVNLDSEILDYLWGLYGLKNSALVRKKTLLELISVNNSVCLKPNQWKLFFSDYSKVKWFVDNRLVNRIKTEDGDRYVIEDELLIKVGLSHPQMQTAKDNLWTTFFKCLKDKRVAYKEEYAEIMDIILYNTSYSRCTKNESYAEICEKLGHHHFQTKETIKAIHYLNEALAIYKNISQDKYYEVMDALGYAYSYSRTTFSNAETYLREVITQREAMLKASDTSKNKDKLSMCLDHLGYVLARDNYREALGCLVRAVDLRLELAISNPKKYLVNLAWSADSLGYLLSSVESLEEYEADSVSSVAKKMHDFCLDLYEKNIALFAETMESFSNDSVLFTINESYSSGGSGEDKNYAEFFLYMALLLRKDLNQVAFTLNNLGISILGKTRSVWYMGRALTMVNSRNVDGKTVLYNNIAVSLLMSEVKVIHCFKRLLYLFVNLYENNERYADFLKDNYLQLVFDYKKVSEMLPDIWNIFISELRPAKYDYYNKSVNECIDAYSKFIKNILECTKTSNCIPDEKLFRNLTETKNYLSNYTYGKDTNDVLSALYRLLIELRVCICTHIKAEESCPSSDVSYYFDKAYGRYAYINQVNNDIYLAEYYCVLNNYGVHKAVIGSFDEAYEYFKLALEGFNKLNCNDNGHYGYSNDIGNVYYNISELHKVQFAINNAMSLINWNMINSEEFMSNSRKYFESGRYIINTLSGGRNRPLYTEKEFLLDV